MLYKFVFQSTLQTCNLNTFVLENDFEYSPFLLTKIEHYSINFARLCFYPTHLMY